MADPSPLALRMATNAAKHRTQLAHTSILVACSGGGDSVALLLLLCELRAEYDLKLSAAHLHHMLRGKEADADADFVEKLCTRLGIPLTFARVDVAKLAQAHKMNLYHAGRIIRKRFLRHAANEVGAEFIALGHNADDRAETLLINLLRGAGLDGLATMPYRKGRFIRPLLEMRREEMRDYLTAQSESWREDSANTGHSERARLRHEVMPLLDEISGRDTVTMFNRTATTLEEEARHLNAEARVWVQELRQGDGLNLERLLNLPENLRRRACLLGLERAVGLYRLSRERWTALWEWLAMGGKGRLDALGGWWFERINGILTIRREAGAASSGLPEQSIPFPGEVLLPSIGLKLVITRSADAVGDVPCCYMSTEMMPGLVVRSRLPGDRMRFSFGSRKLQDVLVDAHVPRRWRDALPLLVCDNEVFWLPGVAKCSLLPGREKADWVVTLLPMEGVEPIMELWTLLGVAQNQC